MLAALYSMAYTVKFMLKSAGRTEFVVPPLEALSSHRSRLYGGPKTWAHFTQTSVMSGNGR